MGRISLLLCIYISKGNKFRTYHHTITNALYINIPYMFYMFDLCDLLSV